jgi:hypothetical protein
MCSVMPGTEVATLSPFGRPFKKSTPDGQSDGYTGCHYEFDSSDDNPQIRIAVNDYRVAADARAALDQHADDFRRLWGRGPDAIAGLCDAASFAGSADPVWCDTCGLQAACGRYYLTVNFKGYTQTVPAGMKQASGVRIIQRLLAKQPFLSGQ